MSGGSAAIAHLLMHHEPLAVRREADAWCEFVEVMSKPYIDDVLRGTLELRLAWRWTSSKTAASAR